MTAETRRLAAWVHAVDTERLPTEVLAGVRRCLLDALVCAGAGARTAEMRALQRASGEVDDAGPGRPWFSARRSSLPGEAFVNGSLVHALDWDDSHRTSKTHPGAAVVPAALATARWAGADAADLLAGVVAGYETTMRLGNAVGVTEHRRRGWHATATCGAVGAAAAAARVLRLDEEQVASALGHGATQAAGLWAFATDGAMSKKIHAGVAARAGVTAAVLARSGVTGSRVVLEAADGGFFRAFADGVDRDAWSDVLAAIGRPYWLPEVALKPYPCCRTAHTAVDAVLALREEGLAAADVDSVDVWTYGVGVAQCGFNDPVNEIQAAFSTPYVVACALLDGWVGPEHFTPQRLADPVLTDLQRRVSVRHDPLLDERFPSLWPSRVTVVRRDGGCAERRVDVARGDPAVPMTDRELAAKVAAGLGGQVGEASADELAKVVSELPVRGDATPVWQAIDRCAGVMRPARERP